MASVAPVKASVTDIQLTSAPVLSRAFSTASTCQSSWEPQPAAPPPPAGTEGDVAG